MVSSFELAGHVVGIMVDHHMDKECLNSIHEMIERKLMEHETINLFCEIMPDQKVPLKFAFEDLKFKWEHSKQIKKMSIVTDIAWIRSVMDFDNLFVSTEVRTFERKDRLSAIQWISQ